MNATKRKKKFIANLSSIGTTITLLLIQCNQCFAESIGTAEVQTATDNIKRVITSIAMPLGRSFNFCKCSCCSIKNDSQFKQPTKKG